MRGGGEDDSCLSDPMLLSRVSETRVKVEDRGNKRSV